MENKDEVIFFLVAGAPPRLWGGGWGGGGGGGEGGGRGGGGGGGGQEGGGGKGEGRLIKRAKKRRHKIWDIGLHRSAQQCCTFIC